MAKHIPRIYLDNEINNNEVILPERWNNHLIKVFRAKINDEVIIYNEKNGEWLCNIIEVNKNKILVKCNKLLRQYKSNIELHLAFCLIKYDNIKLIIEKCTELGITNFHPLTSNYTQYNKINIDKLKTIVIQASEQSERLDIPIIHDIQNINDFIKNLQSSIKWYSAIERINNNNQVHSVTEIINDSNNEYSMLLNNNQWYAAIHNIKHNINNSTNNIEWYSAIEKFNNQHDILSNNNQGHLAIDRISYNNDINNTEALNKINDKINNNIEFTNNLNNESLQEKAINLAKINSKDYLNNNIATKILVSLHDPSLFEDNPISLMKINKENNNTNLHETNKELDSNVYINDSVQDKVLNKNQINLFRNNMKVSKNTEFFTDSNNIFLDKNITNFLKINNDNTCLNNCISEKILYKNKSNLLKMNQEDYNNNNINLFQSSKDFNNDSYLNIKTKIQNLNEDTINLNKNEMKFNSNLYLNPKIKEQILSNYQINLSKANSKVNNNLEYITNKYNDNLSQINNNNIGFIVGPEGGFSEKEQELLINKTTPVSISKNILRAETACICCTVLLSNYVTQNTDI